MDRATSIEDHVTCSICMDLYNDPLALPCLHSFCRRCIQGMFSAALVFNCPECRASVKLGPRGIDELPKNFQLAGIVDTYRNDTEGSRNQRSGNQNSRAFCSQHRMICQLHCKTCKKPVCLKCVIELHSSHKLSLLSAKEDSQESGSIEQLCRDHKRSIKLFCASCEQVVCLECVVYQHSGHHIVSIEETHGYSLVS